MPARSTRPRGSSIAMFATLCLFNLVFILGCQFGGGGHGSGGGGTQGPPNFVLTVTPQGNFTQGQQGATFTVTVSNTGGDQSGGGGSVNVSLPSGLTLVSMAGPGWTCQVPPNIELCQRNDNLAHGASYPPITVTVNVAASATSPQVVAVGGMNVPITILPAAAGPPVVGTAVPYPIFAGGAVVSIPISVTNDAAGDVLTPTLTVEANTGAACTPATCGTLGALTGSSGSGSYSVSYTPPAASGFTTQTVPTIVVSSSLSGSFSDTDFIEVDPPGILVDLGGPGQIAVNAAARTYTSDVYNDVGNAGVSFSILTSGGYACTNIGANSCGTLGAPVKTTSGSTTTTTITYTPPGALPAEPYNHPRVVATSVADPSKSASQSILIIPSAIANTGLRIPLGERFNSTLVGGTPLAVNANIGNDIGNNRTVTWVLSAGGASCSPTCGTLGTPVPTGNGTFVSSAVTYTPPATLPGVVADQMPTLTATSVDNPSATDSFTFSIVDDACGIGHESVLKGQYAFLVRGASANGGYVTLMGSFTADGAGNISGGLMDYNSGVGTGTGISVVSAGSSYTVGADNRVCLSLNGSDGATRKFRAAVGTLVSGVATQGRLTRFDDNNGRRPRQSGVFMKQDPTSFSAARLSGTYAMGLVGVDSGGKRLAGAGVITADGVSALSNFTADFDDGGTASGNLTGGSGWYSIAASGRGTSTTTLTAGPGGPSTTNNVLYMVSSSEVLFLSIDSPLSGKPILSGELKLQTGPFTGTSLDGGDYVAYLEGVDESNGGNDIQLMQAHVTTNGTATVTVDKNDNGALAPEQTQGVVFNIASSGRMTATGAPAVFYLVDSTSGFVVSTDALPSSGFLEKQTGGPFSTASISGAFFGGSDAPTTGSIYDSGTGSFDGAGNFTITGDSSGPNGLNSRVNVGTYSFSSSSVPLGKGAVGGSPGFIAYAISGSKLVFINADPGQPPRLTVVQK